MAAYLVLSLIFCIFACVYILQRLLPRRRKSVRFSKDGKRLIYDGEFSKGLHDHLYVLGHAIVANVFVLESSISLDSHVIRKALTMLTQRFPMLRMKFHWITESSRTLRYLQEIEGPFEVDFTEEDLDADMWNARLEEELHKRLGATGPLWRLIRLKQKRAGTKYQNTFVFTYHHSVSDGLSMLALIRQFLEYLEADDEFNVETLPLLPPLQDLLQHEITLSWWNACSFKLKQFLMKSPPTKNVYLEAFPPVMKRNPLVPKKTCIIAKNLIQEDTQELVRRCKAHKCTVTGAFMAAAAISQSKIIQGGYLPLSLTFTTAVNMRDFCRPAVSKDHFGCFVSFCLLSLQLPGIRSLQADFWRSARELSGIIQQCLKDKEHFTIYKMLKYQVFDPQADFLKLSQDYENMGRRSATSEFSNLGRFQCETRRHKLLSFHFAVAQHSAGTLFANNVVTVDDQLWYTLAYSSHVVSPSQAQEYAESVFSILQQVCCDYSGQ